MSSRDGAGGFPDAAHARAHTVVLDWLEDQLRTGALHVGDKLPGERALAEQFGIGRASVREAVRILGAMGVLHSATGSGPHAGAIIVSEPTTAFTLAMRMHSASSAFRVHDLVHARILLESDAARAAARACATAMLAGGDEAEKLLARRAEVLGRAESIMTKLDDPRVSALEFHALDQAFHRTLAELGDNAVLNTLLASLSGGTIAYVRSAMQRRGDWDAVRVTLNRQHRGILDAASVADGDLAADRIKEHILWFSARVEEVGE